MVKIDYTIEELNKMIKPEYIKTFGVDVYNMMDLIYSLRKQLKDVKEENKYLASLLRKNSPLKSY